MQHSTLILTTHEVDTPEDHTGLGPIFDEKKTTLANAGENALEEHAKRILGLRKMIAAGQPFTKNEGGQITREHGLRAEFRRIHNSPYMTQNEKLTALIQLNQDYLSYLLNAYAELQRIQQEETLRDALTNVPDNLRHWAKTALKTPHENFEALLALAQIPPTAQEIIDLYKPVIQMEVRVGSQRFYLNSISNTGQYLECLFFSLKDGVLRPRLAYKSQSGGEWRVSVPFAEGYKYKKGIYSYTTENTFCIEMENGLHALEDKTEIKNLKASERIAIDTSDQSNEGVNKVNTYGNEIKKGTLPRGFEKLATFKPGYLFREWNFSEEMFNPEHTPHDFIPDFSQPPKKVRRRNAGKMQGEVILELYEVNYRGEVYEIWMRKDKQGWIHTERIRRKNTPVTTYGNMAEVLEFGPYSTKPFEYMSQATGLNPNHTWEDTFKTYPHNPRKKVQIHLMEKEPYTKDSYGDVRPLLAKLPINKTYYEQKRIDPPILPENYDGPKPIRRGLIERIRPTKKVIAIEGIPETQEIKRLRETIEKNGWSESHETINTLLKDPGDNPDRTLRAILFILGRIADLTEEKTLQKICDTILEKFRAPHQLPPEHAVYIGIYRECVGAWGRIEDTKKNPPSIHKPVNLGEIHTHMPEENAYEADDIPTVIPDEKDESRVTYHTYHTRGLILQTMQNLQP